MTDTTTDALPDRLSSDPRSPFYNAEILARTDMIVAAGGGERDLVVDAAILNADVQGNAAPGFLNERLMNDLRPTLFLAQLSNLLADVKPEAKFADRIPIKTAGRDRSSLSDCHIINPRYGRQCCEPEDGDVAQEARDIVDFGDIGQILEIAPGPEQDDGEHPRSLRQARPSRCAP